MQNISKLLGWGAVYIPCCLPGGSREFRICCSAGTLSAILLLPTTFICFLFPPHQSGTPLPSGSSPRASPVSSCSLSSHHDKSSMQGEWSPEQTETTRLSALSTYRAHMMLVTVLAILAVDFPVLPRRLPKCETYEVSFVRNFSHACCLL